ncbi:hypothetical protein BN948_01739 [Hydrogenophaga intermedia]|uniref:Uncharacterized protein n=1 Tax=Hydrogenophaga intermedia TaxID=65786 RepID=A0A1L1PHT7_HYDIT|nr:hypothetical protein [Hydrogenophaga intermedia]CDN87319.1 hypothetical protein BN948_01739 [Hydrogenophaga intermedia]
MQLFKNNAFSTLAAAIDNVEGTLTVASGQGDKFPEVVAPHFVMVTLQDASNNIEIVKVTSRLGGADTMAVERAQEGTTARAWNLGDIVELRVTAFGLQPLQVFAGAATAQAMRDAMAVPSRTGGDASGTWGISISGVAATATALATPRNINGTPFNGAANITTSYWGTARSLTVGAQTRSVDGSANVSFSHSEIDVPRRDGTGATGNWGINILGNASTATLAAGALSLTSTATIHSNATAVTQAAKNATTQVATTAFVDRLRSLLPGITSGPLAETERGSACHANGNITVPANVFSADDVVTIYNNTAGAISIIQGAGLTLRLVATATTGTRGLLARGMATIFFVSATEAVVSGAGVT